LFYGGSRLCPLFSLDGIGVGWLWAPRCTPSPSFTSFRIRSFHPYVTRGQMIPVHLYSSFFPLLIGPSRNVDRSQMALDFFTLPVCWVIADNQSMAIGSFFGSSPSFLSTPIKKVRSDGCRADASKTSLPIPSPIFTFDRKNLQPTRPSLYISQGAFGLQIRVKER